MRTTQIIPKLSVKQKYINKNIGKTRKKKYRSWKLATNSPDFVSRRANDFLLILICANSFDSINNLAFVYTHAKNVCAKQTEVYLSTCVVSSVAGLNDIYRVPRWPRNRAVKCYVPQAIVIEYERATVSIEVEATARSKNLTSTDCNEVWSKQNRSEITSRAFCQ